METKQRLVDANELLKKAYYEDEEFVVDVDDIEAAPTIDAVEVVHGRWIWHNKWELFEFKYECSICHDGSDLESNYCPNCGANMNGA